LRSLFTESDYTNNWEEFRRERERLRKLAADDQAKAREDEIQDTFQQEIQRYGGFDKWVKGVDPKWDPGEKLVCVHDVETTNGLILPSLRAKNKDLVLFIDWALIRIVPPYYTTSTNEWMEGRLLGIYPFCQFDPDKWPNTSDFDWEWTQSKEAPQADHLYDITYKHHTVLNDRAAVQLFDSDKNHYHMLTGVDKDAVDQLTERKAEQHLSNMEPEKYSDYDDGTEEFQ